jgi:hypothetical protein
MKYFLSFLMMMSFSAFSQTKIEVEQVRKIQMDDDVAMITFVDDEHVYKMKDTNGVFPCLKNGWEAPQQVIVKYDEKKDKILDCKLYAAGVLGFEDDSKIQAQEEKKKHPVKK